MPTLFENLPFDEAINSLRERLAMTKAQFMELDAANRSRAFTMAWVKDMSVLESVHDELSQAIAEGKTYADFEKAIRDNQLRGWTGTAAWHHRLVYEQNLGMAFSAGRVQQGTESGLQAWRYLPSISDVPRPDHEAYYNQIYRYAAGSPVPPIDFNCTCGWEWLFEGELESLGIDPATLPVFDPPAPASGFVWSPSSYTDLATVPSSNRFAEAADMLALVTNSGRAPAEHPKVPRTWIDAATKAAAELTAEKLDRLLAWLADRDREGDTLQAMANRLTEAMPIMQSNQDVELDHQATFAALLRGRVDTDSQIRRAA